MTTTRGTDQGLLDIRPIRDFEHALDRFSGIGPIRRRDEVQIEAVLPSIAHESPVIVEPPAVAVAQVVEDHPPCLAEARRHLE